MKFPLRPLIFALCALNFAQNAGAQTPPDAQKLAETALGEKSYARALELLRAAKAAGTVREPEKVDFEIVTALFKTEKWDEAIASANFALKSASWKARFHYLLGQIYVKAPKSGWRLGDKTWRQDEYPEVTGDQKPQQVSLDEEDRKAALEAFETAKIEAQRERKLAQTARFFAPIYPLGYDEECDLNFDLAAYLPQTQFDEFLSGLKDRQGPFDENIDPKAAYASGWSLPKKVLTLYAEIRVLDQGENKADAARSLLAEGLFLRAYKQRMENWANQYDAELKRYVTKPYPFAKRDALDSWQQLVRDFPKSPLAPQALLLSAQTLESQNQLVKAATTWRELVAKYPKSKWVSDARAAIARLEAKELSFALQAATRPGVKPVLRVETRNLKRVEFAAYRVKLEDFLLKDAVLNDPNAGFTDFSQNFGTIEVAVEKFGAPLAKWSFQTKDNADYVGKLGEIAAPFSGVGAYAVVARSGAARFAQIVVVSDLALLKKMDKRGSFVYVANAKSGAAMGNVNVVLKEVWNYNPRRVNVSRGQSDDAGFFDKKRAGDEGSSLAAFAFVGNRYAITGQQGGYYGGNSVEPTQVLGTTDRPVYRPGQTVNFRQIVTARGLGGAWKPLVGRTFWVWALNPKGEKFWESKLKTNEFGSVSGQFNIPAGAPLGEYSVRLSQRKNDGEPETVIITTLKEVGELTGDDSDTKTVEGNTQFRVEEYKRPEFEVTVSAPKEAKRPGEVIAARIEAKYYFGAPVPGAKVKYTVRKSTWWANYQFPTPYDWLYSRWGAGSYDTGRRNIGGEGAGEIIKEGEVTLDEKGFAELSFTSKPLEDAGDNWWARYSNPLYTIEAEVTDASRRTVEAQGQVKVARQPYFAFLDVQRGYFQKGDRVPVEIRTQDANEQSVAASGKMVVYKLLPDDKEERIAEEAITIDASGRAFWNWEATDSGQFRIEYQSKGEWGDEIKAQTEIWVVGDQIGAIRLRGVTILLDKRSYEEGDTLKARVIADKPGASVLLTQEASGEILRRDVLQIDAQSKQISIPIEKKHVPNFFLAAALIQDFEVFQAQTEVFVPPTRQLLNLKVTGDKATYKPGETGVFQVEARDYSGKPARAEVSLALVDASLFYIQKDYAPEIRGFYYGARRENSVNLDSSRSGNIGARSENDDKTPNYERHGWELPDDFGQLQLMPGGFGYYGGGYGGYSLAEGGVHRRAGARMNGAMARESDSAPMVVMAPAPAMKTAGDNRIQAITLPAPPVQVRSNFAETAYWSPSVITEGGKATVRVTFPDSLTQWHATARGLTQNVQVGAAESDVATKKDLLVRLQAPRFFVERDQVVISANVHNYSDKTAKISVLLDVTGPVENAPSAPTHPPTHDGIRVVDIAAGEEKRVDFPIKATGDGQVAIQVTAHSARHGLGFPQKPYDLEDAVKMSFPVFVHGVQRFAAQSGVLSGNETAKISLNFPKERKIGASELNLQLNPSLAAQMLDALPYLADYPYGCVEQTMSRFLPTVLTQKTLRESGINLETLRARAKAYESEAKTPARGERVGNSGYSYPKGQPNSRDLTEMASRLWFHGRGKNPIFDQSEVDKMTREGLNRLYAMQRGDGGWGWWPGSGDSDEYMSAYVIYGLSQARAAGVAVKAEVLSRGRDYLRSQLKDESNLQLLTYLCYSLSQTTGDKIAKTLAAGRLFEQRERLAPLSKAYLAMTLSNLGEKEKAAILVRNLVNTVQIDAKNGTARYKAARDYWNWWNNDVETVALALRAFNQIEPGNKLVPLMVKWLTLQTRGNHYRSTKETAEVVYTLADYVSKNKELDVDYTLKVGLNGKIARTYRVTKDNALFFDNRFIAGDLFLENGVNSLAIEKTGRGKLYWSATSEYFSLEEPIKASGNELEISRKFFKLTRQTGDEKPRVAKSTIAADGVTTTRATEIMPPFPRPQTPRAPEFERAEIKDGANVKSGDLIEVELVVNAKNDYEYLIFEDMKAAGFEPVELRSGASSGDGLSSNVELRDEKVAFFVDKLPQGRRVLRYRVRAEVPGSFHALPTNGYAMYAPEVRAISDEMRVGISE